MSVRLGLRASPVVLAAALVACSGNPGHGPDDAGLRDVSPGEDAATPAEPGKPEESTTPADGVPADNVPDASPGDEAGEDSGELPAPGAFLSPCQDNGDCDSGFCVPHAGRKVCSRICLGGCPTGWDCSPVTGTGGDLTYVCTSGFWALCRPCQTGADCQSPWGGVEECVPYPAGSWFCGATCGPSSPCPDGYECRPVVAASGKAVDRCVRISGECECLPEYATMQLASRCENTVPSVGACGGRRRCTPAGWEACDAATPAPEVCNRQDDDCDGATDEGLPSCCVCGNGTCEDLCGENVASCPRDCTTCGDGQCEPGEGPYNCPDDCCGTCGDGVCRGYGCGEGMATCPKDCGLACGDQKCGPGENPQSCPEDCDWKACGNHVCDGGENPANCPEDCATACGDCACENGEDWLSCPVDCGYCGDGVCSPCPDLHEDKIACPNDCAQGVETCNGKDDNGDGRTDEEGAVGCVTAFLDADGDGYGGPGKARCLCAPEGAWTAPVDTDCDDADPAVHPGATEVCGGRDEDCDGLTDEGTCKIDAGCYADGQVDPANACRACAVEASDTAWSSRPEGTGCGVGQVCHDMACCTIRCAGRECGDDRCGGSCGTCADGKVCDGSVCVADPCPAGYVLVPSGEFDMGSPETEPGHEWSGWEALHHVTLSHGFCLKTTEVTQAEWEAVMGSNPSGFPSCGPTCPVDTVSWWDSVAFCNALSVREGLLPCYELTGCTGTPGSGCAAGAGPCLGAYSCAGVAFAGLTCNGYRLPTEAEWEYAARAGTRTGTYNGTSTLTGCEAPNPVLDPIAWFCGNVGEGVPKAVRGKQANGWGLHDVLGNLGEWVWDGRAAYPAGSVVDPTGPTTSSERTHRGGSLAGSAISCRAAARGHADPGERLGTLGLRPARSIVAPEGPAGSPTCADGYDNDGDGLTDGGDPQCHLRIDDVTPAQVPIVGGWTLRLTGDGLDLVTGVRVGATPVPFFLDAPGVISVTAPSQAAAGDVAVSVSDGVVTAAWAGRVRFIAPADGILANLEWPTDPLAMYVGDSTPYIYGRVDIPGYTDAGGDPGGVIAEIGAGALGSDPYADPGWTWSPAAWNEQCLDCPPGVYEYYAALQFGTSGMYLVGFRFSRDGFHWQYGDIGPLSSDWDPASGLKIQVDPAP